MKMSNQNSAKEHEPNSNGNSPATFRFGKRNNKNSFLNEISNALAANPHIALNNERDKPSFTIQVPNNGQDPRKESWFGSFGLGRKSTENVFNQRQSFSLGQDQGSSNTNFIGTGEKS
jgi:hypothetical protein